MSGEEKQELAARLKASCEQESPVPGFVAVIPKRAWHQQLQAKPLPKLIPRRVMPEHDPMRARLPVEAQEAIESRQAVDSRQAETKKVSEVILPLTVVDSLQLRSKARGIPPAHTPKVIPRRVMPEDDPAPPERFL